MFRPGRVLVLSAGLFLAFGIIALFTPIRLNLDFGLRLSDRTHDTTNGSYSDARRVDAAAKYNEPNAPSVSATHVDADLLTIIISEGIPLGGQRDPAPINLNE